jgi:hypothetical protein
MEFGSPESVLAEYSSLPRPRVVGIEDMEWQQIARRN